MCTVLLFNIALFYKYVRYTIKRVLIKNIFFLGIIQEIILRPPTLVNRTMSISNVFVT